MKAILIFVFLPALQLAQTIYTHSYDIPEFTDLVLSGPFVIKITQNLAKPMEIITRTADGIKGVEVSWRSNSVEIERTGSNLNPIDVQAIITSKSLRNIKAQNGVQIFSNQSDLLINRLTISSNTTVNFKSVNSYFIQFEASYSSKINISDLLANSIYLTAKQNSTFNADKGSINEVNALANSSSRIQFNKVWIRDAALLEDAGGYVDAVVTGKYLPYGTFGLTYRKASVQKIVRPSGIGKN